MGCAHGVARRIGAVRVCDWLYSVPLCASGHCVCGDRALCVLCRGSRVDVRQSARGVPTSVGCEADVGRCLYDVWRCARAAGGTRDACGARAECGAAATTTAGGVCAAAAAAVYSATAAAAGGVPTGAAAGRVSADWTAAGAATGAVPTAQQQPDADVKRLVRDEA